VNTIDAKDFIQFDLGGASIEVSLVLNRKIKESVSVPLGAVTMTDKFGMQDIVTQGVLDKCVKHVEKKFREMIPWAKDRRLPVIGIGGTFMGGLAAIAQQAGFKVTGCDAKMYPPMSTQLGYFQVMAEPVSTCVHDTLLPLPRHSPRLVTKL